MSKTYKTESTFTIHGNEEDARIRGAVDIEYDQGCPTALMDGGVEVWRGGFWVDAEDLLDARDLERAEDLLCELAMSDDSESCDDDERGERRWEDAS